VAKPLIVEQPVTERVFALRTICWRDAAGVQRVADQYTDTDLTPAAAANARRARAVVPIDDSRRRQLKGVHGGRHPRVDTALDLDDEAPCTPAMTADPVREANIVVLDRRPVIKDTISVARV